MRILSSFSAVGAAVCCSYQPPFVAGMKRVSGEARKRSRTLTDDELRRVWAAAGDAGTYGALIKLALLTAQRREKVVTMKWSDLAPDGVWTIATAPREKNNPGTLILPEPALAIIKAQPRFRASAALHLLPRHACPWGGAAQEFIGLLGGGKKIIVRLQHRQTLLKSTRG